MVVPYGKISYLPKFFLRESFKLIEAWLSLISSLGGLEAVVNLRHDSWLG
jgi:hypothetical protein